MFESFKRLFKRGEDPVSAVAVPGLGELRWSEDDEAWVGNHHRRDFSLAYEGKAQPSDQVCVYALQTLSDPTLLESSLAEAKTEAQRTYGALYAAEIEALTLGIIRFYVHEGGDKRILADLDGGKDYRAWRIEYSGTRCEGIGFDH